MIYKIKNRDNINIIVIGAGISGLSIAWLIKNTMRTILPNGSFSLYLLEKENRVGGKIWTTEKDGYVVEAGPNGFLDSKPDTLKLLSKLGVKNQILPSSDAARQRYIFSKGKLHKLPESPGEFLKSKLLSFRGKLRLVAELWQPKRKDESEETLEDFAIRRLGREAYNRLLDPMVSGIFAGNPETMSLRSAFPRIYELERDYGGLLKAMIKISRERKKNKSDVKSGPAGPGGVLTSFKSGAVYLCKILADELSDNLKTGVSVQKIIKVNEKFKVITSEEKYTADIVINAAPAWACCEFTKELLPGLAKDIGKIKYSPMGVVALGYSNDKLHNNLDGFGFLVPREENRNILGVLWTSSIFPKYRTPENKSLIRVMMGGARWMSFPDIDDSKVLEIAKSEIAHTMGISCAPEFVKIFRWKKAIPQYNIGHWALRKRIEKVPEEINGFWIGGNAFWGIGINDCTAAAFRICDEVKEYILSLKS